MTPEQPPGQPGDGPEQPEPGQARPEPDLAAQPARSGLNGGVRDESLRDRSELYPHILIEVFRLEYHGAGHLVFARNLEATGLLDELETAGVLPKVQDTDSLTGELEDLHPEQWWAKHPQERHELLGTLAQWDQALRQLYIGAILGHLFRELLFFSEEEP